MTQWLSCREPQGLGFNPPLVPLLGRAVSVNCKSSQDTFPEKGSGKPFLSIFYLVNPEKRLPWVRIEFTAYDYFISSNIVIHLWVVLLKLLNA